MHVRVCVECGEEYRPEIAVCADCGGRLEDRNTDSDAPPSRPPSASESDLTSKPNLNGHRPVFQTREPREMAKAAKSLDAAGLAFQIAEKPLQNDERRSALVLFVRDGDEPAALRLLAPLHGPDAVAPAAHDADDPHCPACEASLPENAAECPDCGLALTGDTHEDA
jgi:predicted amidophosphoribosyltransferase